MCGVGGKGPCILSHPPAPHPFQSTADRRPIDPPPIVQLRVLDPVHEPPFLQNPYYFMFASLAKPDDDTELHWLKDGRTRCTTGSVVSSLYHLKDPQHNNQDAGFFVFPDLSVRTEGSYRLKLSLFEVVGYVFLFPCSFSSPLARNHVRHCKSIYSAPFYVYTAKKFPGMEGMFSLPLSSSLTRLPRVHPPVLLPRRSGHQNSHPQRHPCPQTTHPGNRPPPLPHFSPPAIPRSHQQ